MLVHTELIRVEKDAMAGMQGEVMSNRTSNPTSRAEDNQDSMRTPFDRS